MTPFQPALLLSRISRSFTTSSAFLQSSVSKTPKTTRQTNSQVLRRTKKSAWLQKDSERVDNLQKQFPLQPVTTFTACEQYNLAKILDRNSLGVQVLIPNEILHFKYNEKHDVLILENGTVVGWGIDEHTVESKILPLFNEAMVSKYEYPESEDMDYLEVENAIEESQLISETIIINAEEQEQMFLDMAAFSSGLSRSTRLAILENALERHIAQTRKITESLSLGQKLSITEKELLRLTGRLFLLRGKLNLYSELIEIPDLYWSEPNLEHIYKSVSSNLDISPRISILNKKLDYATDESRALMQTLNEEKGTRLEWIIIYLIMIEVCFETFHFYERYVNKDTEKK